MVRAERQVVLDMLFSAFEKHQYYNIKELVDITKQPVVSGTRRTQTQTGPECRDAHQKDQTHLVPLSERSAHHLMIAPSFVAVNAHSAEMMNQYSTADLFQLEEKSDV